MNLLGVLCYGLPLLLVYGVEAAEKKLQIGVKKRVDPADCTIKSRKGDTLHMHYTGKLEDGTEFDSSVGRNQPFVFTLGWVRSSRAGTKDFWGTVYVWTNSLSGPVYGRMCEGEKRKLVIPSEMGYGENGAPPKIPGGAALVFEVELLKVERKGEL